jgi:hypothetical protein
MPRKPEPDEDDDETEYESAYFIPDPPLPQSVKEIWERKRRRAQSVKDANAMWRPILESYREYSTKMVFIPWRDT